MPDYLYANLALRHSGCWTEFTVYDYYDTLVSVEYSTFNILKANRISIVRRSKYESKSKLKQVLDHDSSIMDYDFSNLISTNKYTVYSIFMLQDVNSTVIGKLKSRGIIVLNATVRNGIEYYDIISNDNIKIVVDDLLKIDDRIKIVNLYFSNLDEKNLFKAISRNIGNVMFTEKEQMLIKKAEELGYFDSPRKKNLDEFARELGVSKMNISLRLRNVLKKIHNLI
ncbi:helix-turn-helix domain-containing protein [Acidianus sp. RZ1]|uniref:helix-turn-helix domain-containing protein n=1 Tax=Acidianus sp. RZ1 TaxID=1540082 RepID=UPI001491E2A2|nr:helix-turn-helix domain-containing protein [Acidianus sp. RZ1]NON61685.1 bacterio-opsin activator [Acidianus sp. RZ1]